MRTTYLLREALTGLRRNLTMSLAMVITVAVSLTMLGAALLTFAQINDMKARYYADVQVSIFLTADVTAEQSAALRSALTADANVAEVTYESAAEAKVRFDRQFGDNPALAGTLGVDALPQSFRVTLSDPEESGAIAGTYAHTPGVDNVVDQQQTLSRLFGVLRAVQNTALAVAAVMALAALLLIANTIQVAAHSRRREIAIMRVVGASGWLVQAPFIVQAGIAGLVGAVLAGGALAAGKVWLLDGPLATLASIAGDVSWANVTATGGLLAGVAVLVSAVTGWVALRLHTRA